TMTQDATHPSPRLRKTHTNQAVIDALKKLPRDEKITMNKEIETNNTRRNLLRARHSTNLSEYPDNASDDESVITVEEETPSDPKDILARLSDVLSPRPFKSVLGLIPGPGGAKRTRDGEEPQPTERATAKKALEEVLMLPGQPLPAVFHRYIKDTYDQEIYLPLSLFTYESLKFINLKLAEVDLCKSNPKSISDKSLQALNIGLFESKHLWEASLDRAQWMEAAAN
ncbi:hypothetical protein K438DRAFT_1518774, partial [Mycena galopus ATCC 62051]